MTVLLLWTVIKVVIVELQSAMRFTAVAVGMIPATARTIERSFIIA